MTVKRQENEPEQKLEPERAAGEPEQPTEAGGEQADARVYPGSDAAPAPSARPDARKLSGPALLAALSVVLIVAALAIGLAAPSGGSFAGGLFQTVESAEPQDQGSGSSDDPAGSYEADDADGEDESEDAEKAENGEGASDKEDGADSKRDSAASFSDGASSGAGTPSGDGSGTGASASGGAASSNGAASGGNASGNTSQNAAPAPSVPKADTVTVTVSVSSSAVGNPVSGSGTYTFERGATAYDALCALGLSVNASNTSMGIYVAAIGGLAEKEHGSMSGWMYSVNGTAPNYSAGGYVLQDGDSVSWYYVTG